MTLYFLQAGDDGPIKIGITNNLDNRIKQLEKEAPYRIKTLAIYPGDRRIERMIHDKFIKFRIRGEWFEPNEELIFWMDNIIITPTKLFFDHEVKFVSTSEWKREY